MKEDPTHIPAAEMERLRAEIDAYWRREWWLGLSIAFVVIAATAVVVVTTLGLVRL